MANSRLSDELGARLIDRLRQTETFRHYASAFESLASVPLSLCPLREWPPAVRGRDCGNAFCEAMLRAGRTCAACAEVEHAIRTQSVTDPASVTCLGGVCDTGVPVRLGERLIGFLVFGPMLLGEATERQLAKTLALLHRWGVEPDRDKLATTYFGLPVAPPERHTMLARMLIIFAEHLSMLADQFAVQEQHAEPSPVARAPLHPGASHAAFAAGRRGALGLPERDLLFADVQKEHRAFLQRISRAGAGRAGERTPAESQFAHQ